MPRRHLKNVRADFQRTLKDCRRLVADADRWVAPGKAPHISSQRHDSLVELAFFRAYLAWESLLEESFVLYLLGATVPGRRAPRRFVFPPSRQDATAWVVPEQRKYAKWDAGSVSARAERFFRSGYPYTTNLRGQQNALSDAQTIRNAIAHSSENARRRFETLVRHKLRTLPPRPTAGGFLSTTVRGSRPPMSFFDLYLSRFEFLVERIVPS